MALRVHIDGGHTDPVYLRALREALRATVDLSVGDAPDDLAHVACLVSGWPDEGLLDAAAGLRSVVIPFAGPPARTLRVLQGRGLRIFNLHHNASAVAEMALALLLACAKCVVPMDSALRQGDWRPRYGEDPGASLAGRRALVLGYGAIGSRVGGLLRAFGVTVTGIRRTARDGCHGVDDLPNLLPAADVLVVALPGTAATEGLLGAPEIAALPRGSIVVNVGRARVIDEGALYESLRTGHLHSAGLDVWYRYPREEEDRASTMPSSQPFHELDNVVLSPHRAGHGAAVEEERGRQLASLLNLLASGGEPDTQVNVAEGY